MIKTLTTKVSNHQDHQGLAGHPGQSQKSKILALHTNSSNKSKKEKVNFMFPRKLNQMNEIYLHEV